jgi:hypothetical protein
LVWLIHCLGFAQCGWLDFNILTPALLSVVVYGNGTLVAGAA